ncbi:MAG: efflux RND transporter permease subunit [Motiliproteus sp.]
MKLPVLAIRHHQLTLLVSLILVLLGVVSFLTMPRSEDPIFDFPTITLTVVNPGANPSDMESLVVDPIESEINELEDLKHIKTSIEDGLVLVEVEFLFGSDPDEKHDDVVAAVNRVREQLPNSIRKLEVKKASPGEVGVLQLALTHDRSDYRALRHIGERLERKIEQVAGVKRVDLEALPELEVQLRVDPSKLYALGIGLDTVYQAVNSQQENLPGGHAHVGERRLTVRTSGDYQSLAEIENTVVTSRAGQPIYVRNLAQVEFNQGLPSYRARYRDRDALFLNVIQRQGSNIFDVTTAIDEVIAGIETTLPAGVALYRVAEQRDSVSSRVNGFFINLLQGLALVALACLLVLGRRPSVVVVTAVPVSIFIAIGWLDLTGFGLQQMSIVGLVIALGLLVDNAIVVTENVLRLQRQGLDADQAASRGSRQVALAVVSGTLTTVLSFVPMLMMQNGSGTFIRSMPVTVVLTLVASLVVALTLTPLMAKRMALSPTSRPRLQRGLDRLASGPYSRGLAWTLRHPLPVLMVAVLLTGSALMLFPKIGVSLFPKAEKSMLLVNLELAEGASFYRTQAVAETVADELLLEALVEDVAINIGRGHPRIYYNVNPSRQKPNFAQLLIKLNDSHLAVVEPFVERIRSSLDHYPGVQIRVKEFAQGPPTVAPISVRVLGEEWLAIRDASSRVVRLLDGIDGTVNVDNPIGKNQIDLKVDINRDKAAMVGLPLSQVDQNIRAALVGLQMGSYRDAQGDEFAIVLRSSNQHKPELEVFDTLKLKAQSGAMVPFNQIARLKLESGMPRLQHHNLERMARITADVRPGYNTEALTNRIIVELEKLSLPEGVRFAIGGEQASRKESFGGMAKALIIALLGIFTVLVMQFRSFTQPLIVLATIPFAATGAFFGLYLTGYTFSFTAFVGLTSLVGIVVNNAIILVDYANQLRQGGAELSEAILTSARTRMTPILLTSVTTIAGLLPLTLSGSSLWTPMGVAIIAGLLISTLLSLFVVPVLYRLFTPSRSIEVNDGR